jgi:hypothetical protein
MTEPTLRVTAWTGTDEVNHNGVSYRIHEDGSFTLPASVFQYLINAGFKLAPLTQGQRLRDVFDAITKLDPGSMKTALWAAATAESLRAVKRTEPAQGVASNP